MSKFSTSSVPITFEPGTGPGPTTTPGRRFVTDSSLFQLAAVQHGPHHSNHGHQREVIPHHYEPHGVRNAEDTYEPAFNLLYVETPRVPILEEVFATFQETANFLKPLTRLGLPETTIHNKCPYYNPEGPHPIQLITPKLEHVAHLVDSGALYHHSHTHIPHYKPLFTEIPPWSVAVFNVSFLLGLNKIATGRWMG